MLWFGLVATVADHRRSVRGSRATTR